MVLRDLPAGEVAEYGSALAGAAAAVTEELGGTNPWTPH
jgi:L-serine deaminase